MSHRCALIFAFLAIVVASAAAQPASIHRIESERHGAASEAASEATSEASTDTSRSAPVPLQRRASMPLAKRVFGWVPYWIGSAAWDNFDWSALTTIGFFSYEVDTVDGGARTMHGWPVAALRDRAHANGVAYVLTVTNFGVAENTAILSSPTKRALLAQSLAITVASGDGDGVNVDFEGVPGAQRDNLTAFMNELASAVRAVVPNAEISMAIPAVDWSGAFDVAALDDVCDYLIMMGYDYHWSSAPTAGPVAPLAGESQNVTRSVDTYLARGLAAEKFLLGVPWYGFDWATLDSTRGSATLATGAAILYGSARANAPLHEQLYDAPTSTPWYRYNARDQWHQVWYDDSASLGLKYRLVNERGLAGIGIWALGYQLDAVDVWQGIHEAFDRPSHVSADEPMSSSLAVMGGSLRVGIARDQYLRLELFDAIGALRAVIHDGHLDAGMHVFSIEEYPIGRGVYFVRASTGGGVAVMVR